MVATLSYGQLQFCPLILHVLCGGCESLICVVNSFTDLHEMGLSNLLFDPVMSVAVKIDSFGHAAWPRNTQCESNDCKYLFTANCLEHTIYSHH